MIELNKIYNEECLNGMKRIPDRSVDAVICDLPYGTTDLEWDNVIPLDKLWKEYKRILRPNGWALLTASNPFSALLIMSNKKNFSHQWIWDKKNTGNPLLAKKQPLKNFEDVLLFQNKDFSSNDYEKAHPLREYGRKLFEYIGKPHNEISKDFIELHPNTKGNQCSRFLRPDSLQFALCTKQTYQELQELYKVHQMKGFREFEDLSKEQAEFKKSRKCERIYNPQMVKGEMRKRRPIGSDIAISSSWKPKEHFEFEEAYSDLRYPKAIISFPKDKEKLHPTQKPVSMFEYMIKTYTNEGDTVLDNCMGSGTTAIACLNTKRNFIGFELSKEYFDIATKRVDKRKRELDLLDDVS